MNNYTVTLNQNREENNFQPNEWTGNGTRTIQADGALQLGPGNNYQSEQHINDVMNIEIEPGTSIYSISYVARTGATLELVASSGNIRTRTNIDGTTTNIQSGMDAVTDQTHPSNIVQILREDNTVTIRYRSPVTGNVMSNSYTFDEISRNYLSIWVGSSSSVNVNSIVMLDKEDW